MPESYPAPPLGPRDLRRVVIGHTAWHLMDKGYRRTVIEWMKRGANFLPTNLGITPYPELTSGFLYGVPLVFVLWPSILFGLNHMTKGRENGEKGELHGDHD